jgi:hypothetical protein
MTRNPAYKPRAAPFVTLPLKRATIRVAPQPKVAGDHVSHEFSATAIASSRSHSCVVSRSAS